MQKQRLTLLSQPDERKKDRKGKSKKKGKKAGKVEIDDTDVNFEDNINVDDDATGLKKKKKGHKRGGRNSPHTSKFYFELNPLDE